MTDRRTNVLIIEDNPADARIIQEYLSESRHASFGTRIADRLSAGFRQLAQGQTDVVLLDLSLPDSSGLDTLLRLRREEPDLPIVVLTGLDDDDTGIDAVRAGAQDYLVKGQVNRRNIIRAIRYSLERAAAKERLRASREEMQQLFDSVADAILVLDDEGRINNCNQAVTPVLGFQKDELIGKKFTVLKPEGNGFDVGHQKLAEGLDVHKPYDGDILLVHRDGRRFPASIRATLTEGAQLHDRRITAVIRDVSCLKNAEALLREQVIRDFATGLYNRRHIWERLETEVLSAERYEYPLAVCLCDVDDLKSINDRYGHMLGDEVLCRLCRVMVQQLRRVDIAGRYGGDEFMIVFPHTTGAEAAIVVEHIRRLFGESCFFAGDQGRFKATASFGLVERSAEHRDVVAIFRDADRALYVAKSAGRGQVEFRESEPMPRRTMRRRSGECGQMPTGVRSQPESVVTEPVSGVGEAVETD